MASGPSIRRGGRPVGERRRFRPLHAGESGLEGIVIYRFDGPLFFANVGQFVDEIRALVVDGEPPVHAVVVSAEAITAFDSTAEEACRELVGELQARHVHLLFARTRAPFRDALRRAGLLELLGASSLYPTVAAAVEAANAERPRIVAGQGA